MSNKNKQSFSKEIWLTEEQLAGMPYFKYWNNRGEERKKIWDISDGDFNKLENGIKKKGLIRNFDNMCRHLKSSGSSLKGVGASLGSGTCWLEAKLLTSNRLVKHIYCVEFSKHRIFDLAPMVLGHYKVPADKVKLCLGSFYDLKIASHSLDFIILSQAFYIADHPDSLLKELKRVIKKNGIIILLAEHYHPARTVCMPVLKHLAKWLLNYRKYRNRNPLLGPMSSLLPYSAVKGNHHYGFGEYKDLFAAEGFTFKRFIDRTQGIQNFILYCSSQQI